MVNNDFKSELELFGYSTVTSIYSNNEIECLINCINDADHQKIGKDIYAIRQVIKYLPWLKSLIFNNSLIELLNKLFETNYFLTKSIFFDNPPMSNWFVPYHQDLSISADSKHNIEGYKNWTFKKDMYGVQPPIKILEKTITVRIHLDDTTKNNGALRIIP